MVYDYSTFYDIRNNSVFASVLKGYKKKYTYKAVEKDCFFCYYIIIIGKSKFKNYFTATQLIDKGVKNA